MLEERTIATVRPLKPTSTGQPRFRVGFTDGSSAVTSSDARIAVGEPGLTVGCTVLVSFTRTDRISHMQPVSRSQADAITDLQDAVDRHKTQ